MNPDDLVLGMLIEQRAEIMQLRAELAQYQSQPAESVNDAKPTFDVGQVNHFAPGVGEEELARVVAKETKSTMRGAK